MNREERKIRDNRRILESILLSPDFDFLEIDNHGYLKEKFPIPGSMSFTRDKVAAASFIEGERMMDEHPELGWGAYYLGVNSIHERTKRRKVYSDEQIADTIKNDKEKTRTLKPNDEK